MNKEELEQKISSMEKELSNLKEQIKLCKGNQGKIWQPKEDEEYWTIGTTGDAFQSSNNCNGDKIIIEQGNYFKTKEEAEKQAEYNRVMNRFRKYVEAYSEPLDWNNTNQYKCCVVFDYSINRIRYLNSISEKGAFDICASSEQVLKDAIIYSAGSEEEFIRIVFGVKDVKN